VLYFGTHAFAQNIDSLRNEFLSEKSNAGKAKLYAQIAYELSSQDADSAVLYASKGIMIAGKNTSARAKCLNAKGWSYYRSGNKDSAIWYLLAAKNLYHQLNEISGEARSSVNLSNIYNTSGDREKALSYLLPARVMFGTSNDDEGKAYAEREIGIIYREQGYTDKAMQYLKQSYETYKRLNISRYLADAASSIGVIYVNARNYDSAFWFYREAVEICNNENNLFGLAYAYENLGDAHLGKSNYNANHPWIDSALYFYTKASQLFKKIDSKENEAYEKIKVANVLQVVQQYDKAIDNLKYALHYFDSTKSVNYAFEASNELSVVYEKKGDYKNAFIYLQQSKLFKDSLDARNNKDAIAKMFALYETQKKDQEINLLNTQKQIASKELSLRVILEVAGFLMLLMLFLLMLSFWNRTKMKQKIKEVEIRNRLAADLHDDIGSSLSSILLLSDMASKNTNAAISQSLIEKIGISAKEVIEKMDDIVWTMNPENDNGKNLKERIEGYVLQGKQFSDIEIRASVSYDLASLTWPMEIRKNIFLICKEAINNALKYANPTIIDVILTVEQSWLYVNIKDNGKGFDVENRPNGLGFSSMKQRAEACGGTLQIHSKINEGTNVEVIIPLTHIRYI
jgi:signal transduction histidine kinase